MRQALSVIAGIKPTQKGLPRRDRGAVWQITPTSGSASRVPPGRRELGAVWQLTPQEGVVQPVSKAAQARQVSG
jgi:hypothetical protein